MPMKNRIMVNREIFEWAIRESQLSMPIIRSRFKAIDQWIAQELHPTYKQLEKFAHFLKVPFGYMFLDNPPAIDIIESEYRTLGNKAPFMSKNLKDTISDMSRKKDWLSDFRRENGWARISDTFVGINPNMPSFADNLKRYLNIDDHWYEELKDHNTAFKFLRRHMELNGIIVMQRGIVGNNNKRILDINEFRGFVLFDEYAPLIFINARDSVAGKIFTLIHEFVHIVCQEDDILTAISTESQINKIVAEFLMPEAHIHDIWSDNKDKLAQIEHISRLLKVSKLALAIRLGDLGLIDESEVQTIYSKSVSDFNMKMKGTGGGDYWRTFESRYSEKFVKAVVTGAESGDIGFNDAFALLDLRATTYDSLIEKMGTLWVSDT